MGLADPFSTTAALAQQGLGAYGQAFQQTASAFAERKQKELALVNDLTIKKQLLGEEYKMKGELQKKELDLKSQQEQEKLKRTQDFISNLFKGGTIGTAEQKSGIGLTGYTLDPISGDVKVSFGQTTESKIKEQAQVAKAKERETAIGKAERLKTVGETVKSQWLKTSPYKGVITKTGFVPILGQWDILKKGLGATSAQRQDQVYANFIQGIRAQLARGMGDVGNLSEYEQRAVIQLVPNLYDSYESGILKLSQLSQLVEDIKKTRGINSSSAEGEDFSNMSDGELKKIAGM